MSLTETRHGDGGDVCGSIDVIADTDLVSNR